MTVIFIFTAQPLLHYHYTFNVTIIPVKCVSTGIIATNSNYFLYQSILHSMLFHFTLAL